MDITHTYDENSSGRNGIGRLTTVTDQSGTTSYSYGARGNLTSQTHTQDGLSFTTHYAYNTRDELIKITYPSSRTVDYTRNSLGRITDVSTTGNGQTNTLASGLSYLPFGPYDSLTFGNGILQTSSYDPDYRLTDLVDGAVLDYIFTLDAVSNITARNSITQGNESYQYDALNRLTQGTVGADIENFTYDDAGNRQSRTLNGNTKNYFYGLTDHHLEQVANGTTHSYTFDAVGNTLTTYSYQFAYGDNNRLEVGKDTSSTVLATYTYNTLGQRTRKVGGSTVYYQYDSAGHLISESNNLGNITKEYIYLYDTPIAMLDSNGLYFIHTDQLGTPKVLTNTSQTVVWAANHTPFGDATVNEDADNNSTDVVMNLRFAGQYFDSETGLHYNWMRYYDPDTGRYIASDPIGLRGGLNTYGYVGGNPVSFIDPLGLAGCYVGYPGYPIAIPGTDMRVPLTHSGVLSYDSQGHTQYYEYGRYDSDFGNVRRRTVPDLTMGPDGQPTADSWAKMQDALNNIGHGTEAETSCEAKADADKINSFAEQRMHDQNRAPYSWNPLHINTCTTFAGDAFAAGLK